MTPPLAAGVNFDGLVGPTHNYAGLSHGNVASRANRDATSRPRAAALQGLAKMRLLARLGLPQAVLPPHDRPSIATLRAFGFSGPDARILADAARSAPALLAACGSASAMWTANAATVAPSADTADGRVHLTVANLASKLHRSLEAPTTGRILRRIFADELTFAIHPPLPGGAAAGDEGAANHTRFAPAHGQPGLHLFVHGHTALDPASPRPSRFPARQSLEASAAVARLHRLPPGRVLHLRQDPAAIDAGVFHHDVIGVGHLLTLFVHELAFAGRQADLDTLRRAVADATGGASIRIVEVPAAGVPLADAVASYLFNSQLLSLPDGSTLLLAPAEVRQVASVARWLDEHLASPTPAISRIETVDLRESMRNGGGPACLRLRVELTPAEHSRIRGRVFLDDALHDDLAGWINRHYRESLSPGDLADPALLDESRRALDELTSLLHLGPVYDFQR